MNQKEHLIKKEPVQLELPLGDSPRDLPGVFQLEGAENLKGVQNKSICYLVEDTGYILCIPDCCSVSFDLENKLINVLQNEVNLLPPNVKQRVTNKFYSACKKAYTKPFALLPLRPMP